MIEWILSSCVLILAVLLIRRCLRSRLQPMLQYALWGLVLIRLLLPFQFFNNPVSVGGMVEEVKKQPAVQAVTDKLTKPDISFEQAYEQAVQDFQQAGQQVQPLPDYAAPGYKPQTPLQQHTQQLLDKATPAFRLENLLLAVWLVGITVTAVCFAVSNIRFLHVLHKRRRLLETHESGLKIYACSGLDTPCLFGILRPSVYLLEEEAENETRKCHVVTHEITHYRHGDHVWSLLRCICLILHWYNPLVWLAAILSRQDGELACDTATLQKLGEQQRVAYGQTLIEMTCAKTPGAGLMNTATTMTGGKAAIKERVMMIAKRPKTVLWALILAVAIAVAAVGCTASGISGEKGDAAEPTSPTTAPAEDATTVPTEPPATAPAEDATTAPTEPPATAPTDPFAAYVEGHKELTGEEFAPLRALLSDIHSPANMALFSEYADPKDVNIRYLLDGSGEIQKELSDAEWAFLESKNKEVRNMDVARNSTAQIDAVLMQLFGLKLSETNKVGLDAFDYFADTDSYYFAYTGSEFVFPEFVKAVWTEDGSIVVCYINHMNNEYKDPWDYRVVTVSPVDGGYHFLSNRIVAGQTSEPIAPDPSEMIDIPYEYPIVPGTPEWAEHSKPELLKLCRIPNDLLTRLTTPALLETCLGYPYIIDCIAYNFPEQGFDITVNSFNGLRELVTRTDLVEALEAFDLEKSAIGQSSRKDAAEIGLTYLKKWVERTTVNASYSITEPYAYPVTAGSLAWATMTQKQKIAACQVPEDVLKELSPQALAVTMANYPLFADSVSRNNILSTMKSSNVYAEAMKRCDVSIYAVHSFGFTFEGVADYAEDYMADVLSGYFKAISDKLDVFLWPIYFLT